MSVCEYVLSARRAFFEHAMPKNISCRTLTDNAIQRIASRFRALGDASRLKLLLAVEIGEKNVSELVALTGLSQPNVSRHLQTLTNEGVFTRRKEGASVYYSAVSSDAHALCRMVSNQMQERLANQSRTFRK